MTLKKTKMISGVAIAIVMVSFGDPVSAAIVSAIEASGVNGGQPSEVLTFNASALVPIPAAVWLFASSLGFLGVSRIKLLARA